MLTHPLHEINNSTTINRKHVEGFETLLPCRLYDTTKQAKMQIYFAFESELSAMFAKKMHISFVLEQVRKRVP